MNTFIKENPKLIDIYSEEARNNLTLAVNYLCSSIVPDEYPLLIQLGSVTMQECHDYISKFLYNQENATLANSILQNRTKISDYDYECLDGFAAIYDLNRENLIEVDSTRYFETVVVLEHEMIHILAAVNNNNPEEQYNEFLSIFGELLSSQLLSDKYGNSDIYINNLITRCVKRMSYRVYGTDFEDDVIESKSEYIKDFLLSSYDYMIGFIYAIRLLELYHLDSDKVLEDFNLILAGKKSVKELLEEYHISLEDKNTIDSFIKMVDTYRECVDMKYGHQFIE